MSWLGDFVYGEAVWKRLLAAPSVGAFHEAVEALTPTDRWMVFLYHAIRDKQATGEWDNWQGSRSD